jgi:tetratricopeptide (TPR) repeat protein
MPILFTGGMKAYNSQKYESALKIFSLYQTAYPEDNKRGEYMLACTLMQQGRYNASMILFSRVLEKYPDSSEATESIVAFANIGIAVPKMKGTLFTQGWEWHRDPIQAYNTALKRQRDWAASEHILYAKGYALMVLGRYEEAQKTLIRCVKVYPSSTKIRLYKTSLGANLPPLVKIFYERGDYAGVVSTYFQTAGSDAPLPVDAATVIIIGKSLYHMGMNEDASNYLKAARIKANGKDADEISRAIGELGRSTDFAVKICDETLKEYRDLQSAGKPVSPGLAVRCADCLYMARQYGDSIPIYRWALENLLTIDEKRWALLRTGQANMKLGKADIAKTAFDELKATGADEFWSKLADFAYDDGKWTEKYNQLTKKR